MIPLRSHPDLLHGPPRILRQDPIQPVSAVLYMVRHDLDIRRLPCNAVSVDRRLMYHNLRVGESHALPLCPSPKEERPKACGHAQADSGDITPDILHGIVNSQPCGYGTARAVDVKLNIFFTVLRFQKKHLGNNQPGRIVADLLT